MARKKQVKLSKKEAKYRLKIEQSRRGLSFDTPEKNRPEKKTISVSQVIPIRTLAELIGKPVSAIIEILFKNGVSTTINESIDYETAVLISDELNVNLVLSSTPEKNSKSLVLHAQTRPPIVTIMGHVDHGKTMLLDAIRETNVVEQEEGGITQHIGAYQVTITHEGKKRDITFLDTPGHEAFSALRAHGANLTDIVVLVVAANEGVKPQTLEAISHAKSAQVPIIVAINKIDLPDADIDRIKTELAKQDLSPEEWGGKTPYVLISAKKKQNIKELLDMIILVADLQELTADQTINASGIVIESHIASGIGPLATILVQQGNLKPGQAIVVGKTWGKIKYITDWKGMRIENALPSTPVVVAGLKSTPQFGDVFNVVENEKVAKDLVKLEQPIRNIRSATESMPGQSFNIIIKADVAGSLEAIRQSINDIPKESIKINIISEGIGDITETDINLAVASNSFIYGFRVNSSKVIDKLANTHNISIKIFDIIYKMMDDIYASIEKSYQPDLIEEETGEFTVIKDFFQTKDNAILGGKVTKGVMTRNTKVKIYRREDEIGEGKLINIKIGPSEVMEVKKDQECGLEITKTQMPSDNHNLKEGDRIICIIINKKEINLNRLR